MVRHMEIDFLKGAKLDDHLEVVTRVSELKKASEQDFSEEFLDLIISVKIVADIDDAIQHINKYGSKHTDVIITSNLAASQQFIREIDSAAVVVNASSRFNDGGQQLHLASG